MEQVLRGYRHHPESDLRLGHDESLFHQTRQHFAQDTGAGVVPLRQFREGKPGTRREAASKNFRTQALVHLVGPSLRTASHCAIKPELSECGKRFRKSVDMSELR